MAISAQDVRSTYAAAGLPPPSAQDIQYWTQTYAQSPDVAFSPNPQQQVVNAILAAAPDQYDQGQFNFLAGGANLAGTTGINIPQSDADIRRQVEADVAEFIRARDAGQSTAGIGQPSNASQFTAPIVNVPVAQPSVDPASVQTIGLNLPTRPPVDTTNLFTGGGTQGATVNPPTPTGFQGASRDDILGLYRSIGLPDPSESDISFWQNFSRTNPDVIGAANPMTQLTNAFRTASRQQLTPDALSTTGQSSIDPLIAPYLQEALGVARNLFLTGEGPQLFPGQMYVSPSAQTEQALTQAERIATSPEAQALSTQGLQAYQGALGGLSSIASGDYMQSPEYQRYLESVTRPVTEQVTQQILPSIASQYSAAGRYGSGAMQQATGRATEFGARALGDITSQVAQQQQGRMLEAQTALPSFLGSMPQVLGGALAPSQALASVGAQREAIAGQPLQESIRRFEYGQQLPSNQLSAYLSSIYGSPLGRLTGQPEMQGNTNLQNIGGLLNVATAIPSAVRGVQTGYDFLSNLFSRTY